MKHLNGTLAPPHILELQVDVLPLADLLEQNDISDFHLLHIDVEGHDFEFLKTIDLKVVTPWLIYIEHMHLVADDKIAMLELLESHSYSLRNCGSDFFAMSAHASQVLDQLSETPD